jgi:hypothetical protein
MPTTIASNVSFLKPHNEQLVRLARLAERHFPEAPNTGCGEITLTRRDRKSFTVSSMKTPLRMRQAYTLLLVSWFGAAAHAEPPANSAATEQAQAIQFGIFFGGMASQYDLCVKKGFLPKGSQSAEVVANGVLDKMQEFNHWTDQRSYVRKGWETAKQQLAQHDADYTREKCTWVATEWKKMEATMRVK